MKQIFIAAALLLSVVSCDSNPATTAPASTAAPVATAVSASATSEFPFAYVDVDLVVAESEFFKKEGLPIQLKGEAAQRDWTQKDQQFQTEYLQLNNRYQNGLITTANAQLEQQKLDQRVASFQESMQLQAATIDEENMVFSNRTQQLMREALKSINSDGRYKMIFSATSLIEADTLLDITDLVRAELDRLYAAESATK